MLVYLDHGGTVRQIEQPQVSRRPLPHGHMADNSDEVRATFNSSNKRADRINLLIKDMKRKREKFRHGQVSFAWQDTFVAEVETELGVVSTVIPLVP